MDDILCQLQEHHDADIECDQLLRDIQRQQIEMATHIHQIRAQQIDYIERTKLNMGDLIEEMAGLRVGVDGLHEYVQHVGVSHPQYGQGRHDGRGRGRGRF